MKKRTIIPAIIAMGFFAGCDWSSWCSCSKNKTEAVKVTESKHVAKNDTKHQEPESEHEDDDLAKSPAQTVPTKHIAKDTMPKSPALEEAKPKAAGNPMLEALEKANAKK